MWYYEEIEIGLFAGLTDWNMLSLYLILSNRWFCVESGNADNPSVILIHGFPSQVSHNFPLMVEKDPKLIKIKGHTFCQFLFF